MMKRLGFQGVVIHPLVGFSVDTLAAFNLRRVDLWGAGERDLSLASWVLRGAVVCAQCSRPLSAAWSTSRNGVRYPYYFCPNRYCVDRRKSIRRAVIEKDFGEILQRLQPTSGLFALTELMFRDAWTRCHDQTTGQRLKLQQQLAKIERDIGKLFDRILNADNSSVADAYEKRIAMLENDKLLLTERIEHSTPTPDRFETLFKLAMDFLSNPWKAWKNGSFVLRRTILKLTFAEPLQYCRKTRF